MNQETQLNEYTKNLSRDQKQIVAIARILANNPEVILFDEPTSVLDHLPLKSYS